jgi:hypothetical protein
MSLLHQTSMSSLINLCTYQQGNSQSRNVELNHPVSVDPMNNGNYSLTSSVSNSSSNCSNLDKKVWLKLNIERFNIRESFNKDNNKFNKSIKKNKFIKFNKKSIKYIDATLLYNNNNIDLPKQPKLYTIDDLNQNILNKNKSKIKSILSTHINWFNDNLIYAFDILKDDFGMYLSAKRHKQPLDYFNIISNKRTDILNWILNKYNTLYPIFGTNSVYSNNFNNPKFRNFIWSCIDTDSAEFVKNLNDKYEIIGNLIPINKLYQTCFKNKLNNIFTTFIEYFSNWNIEEYLLYNYVPNAGKIALEYLMFINPYKNLPNFDNWNIKEYIFYQHIRNPAKTALNNQILYDRFIEKKSPNVLDVLNAFKNLPIFNVKHILLIAINSLNSTVYFEYFKTEHYFDYDINYIISIRNLNGVFIKYIIENTNILTEYQTKILWFDLCYLLYNDNYHSNNILEHQIIKQFIEYCLNTKFYPVYQFIRFEDFILSKNIKGEVLDKQKNPNIGRYPFSLNYGYDLNFKPKYSCLRYFSRYFNNNINKRCNECANCVINKCFEKRNKALDILLKKQTKISDDLVKSIIKPFLDIK